MMSMRFAAKTTTFVLAVLVSVVFWGAGGGRGDTAGGIPPAPELRFTVLYDNQRHEASTLKDRGFSCLVEGAEMEDIPAAFKEMKFENCGAVHCTGDGPISEFKAAFGDHYVPMATGEVIGIFGPRTHPVKPARNILNFFHKEDTCCLICRSISAR